MKRFAKITLIVLFVSLRWTFAWASTVPPFYLSFEQRVLTSYALLAQGQDEAGKAAIVERFLALKKKNMDRGAQTLTVRNFDEFLKAYRGDWPGTNSLDLDLRLIEQGTPRGIVSYRCPSPRIQNKIDGFIKSQNEQLMRVARQGGGRMGVYTKDFIAGWAGDQAPNLLGAEKSSNRVLGRKILDVADKIVTEQMKELDHLGEKMAHSDLGGQSDLAMKIMLETVMNEYFARLGGDSRKQIVSAYLGGDLNATDLQKFELMIQNSGPQLQKMLQVIARQGDLAPDMLAIFRELESSVRAVPWVQVQQILEQEKANYQFTYFEHKPLGVGTMAQVHRAKILINGERRDVVVRFIKPGIAQRVDEDHRILMQVAKILDGNPEFLQTGMPQLTPLVEDITRTVTAELDQNATIERQKLAARAYERTVPFRSREYKSDLHIHVPEIFPAPQNSRLMVQEMVFGSKLDKEAAIFTDVIPDLKRVVVEQMAQVWLQEVLFGGGFYHSDLHQGNFMVQVAEPAIRLNILDFGMGGVLPANLQHQVLILGAAMDLLDGRLLARSFWNISDKSKNKIDEATFGARVEERINAIREGRESGVDTDHWTAWALDQGLRLPYEFISLNRGMVIMTKLLSDAGSPEDLQTLTQRLAMKYPLKTYRILSEEGGLSKRDLFKLGWTTGTSPEKAPAIAIPSKPVMGASRCENLFQ